MSVHDPIPYPSIKAMLDIPVDEPIFIIRAQDAISLQTIDFYSEWAEKAGCSTEFIAGLSNIRARFRSWQTDQPNGTKIPD